MNYMRLTRHGARRSRCPKAVARIGNDIVGTPAFVAVGHSDPLPVWEATCLISLENPRKPWKILYFPGFEILLVEF